jgi:hypothetical protein
MTKRKVENTTEDPTLSKTPVEINGKTYHLCFDLGSLAEAESHFKAQGHEVNLLRALPQLDLSNIMVIFPCALRKFHPDVKFAHAQSMVTLQNVYGIAAMIAAAWGEAIPKPEAEDGKADPPNP